MNKRTILALAFHTVAWGIATLTPGAAQATQTSVVATRSVDFTKPRGSYANPRFRIESGKAGDIHWSGAGPLYEARSTNSGASEFPPSGQDNAAWFYRGEHQGTFSDPKSPGEVTYFGAVHRDVTGVFYMSKVAADVAPPFPQHGSDNEAWAYGGLYAGTFSQPKVLGDRAYKNAIFLNESAGGVIFESQIDGLTSALTTPFPSPAEHENTWWKKVASGCTLAGAGDSRSMSSSAEVMQRIPAGRYLDIQSLIDKAPGSTTSELLAGVRAPELQVRLQKGNYTVRSANLLDVGQGAIVGEIVVVTRNDGMALSLINTATHQGMLTGDQNGVQKWTPLEVGRVSATDSIITSGQSLSLMAPESASRDCAGHVIVDVLAGFSNSSAAYVGDVWAFALAQVETSNLGLRNSKIDVRLRLVHTQTIETDYGINTDTLAKVNSLFSTGAEESHADVIAAYFYPHWGSTAEGWAYTGGRITVNKADNPSVFRHEVGHNAGGSHCSGGVAGAYKFGYARLDTVPTKKTFMCGNNTSFYSNPLILDEDGQPRGNGSTADMARVWGERARTMSGYKKAVDYPVGIIE